MDAEFARSALGTDSLPELRAKSADEILQAALKEKQIRFAPNVDGYFLPEDATAIYAQGKQSAVPLLAGWNLDEARYGAILGQDAPTAANFRTHLQTLYGAHADQMAKLYVGSSDAEVKRAAQDLASDRFIAFSTWKWLEMLPLRIRRDAAARAGCARGRGGDGTARVGDRICVPGALFAEASLASGRPQGIGTDGQLLD
jgi:carboxylesterase type B